jgi:hypothetical protein
MARAERAFSFAPFFETGWSGIYLGYCNGENCRKAICLQWRRVQCNMEFAKFSDGDLFGQFVVHFVVLEKDHPVLPL